MPSNHPMLYCPLLCLPSIFPSIRVFSNESALHIRSPKYWSFSFTISPSSEYSRLISFRTDLILIHFLFLWVSSVQLLSHVLLFVTPWIAARQASLSITNSQSLLKLMSIESVMPSSHLIFCCPLLLLPLIPPSIRVFSNESTLHMKWPKYWSFSFCISPSNEHPRTDLLYNGLVGSPCSPRDSQEFSPTPQFKSINSSVLSFLHSPTLTSIHEHWKNHNLD